MKEKKSAFGGFSALCGKTRRAQGSGSSLWCPLSSHYVWTQLLQTSGNILDSPRNALTRITGRQTVTLGKKRLFLLPVNSKAEVRFHLASADWIPEAVRQKMASMVSTPQLPGGM